jgi:histidine ammonia-lyase
MTAAQAIDFKAKGKLGKGTNIAYNMIREKVETLETDRVFYKDMNACFELIQTHKIVDAVETAIGKLY